MGASDGQLLALGASRADIVEALGNEPAYLASLETSTVIFSRTAAMDPHGAAVELSRLLPNDVLAFFVHDDDILACALCRGGETIAEVSVPTVEEYAGIDADELELMAEYLDEDVPSEGSQNDPTGFVMGVGTGDLKQALHVLSDEGLREMATDRYRDLLAALELPTAIAGWSYYAFEQGIDGFEGPTPTRINP